MRGTIFYKIGVGLAALVCALSGGYGQDLASGERSQRRDDVIAAEEALVVGDQAYQSGDFDTAVDSYRAAFQKLPTGDLTRELQEAVRERYAQAAVQAARVKNRKGDRSGAISLVEEVLSDSVYPDYAPAQVMAAKLQDPIRTNPAATAEHAANVDEVRRLLYLAEGAFNSGEFDKAEAHYQSVLRIDSYNKAARRGMEKVAAEKTDYYRAASDQTRADMLSQVAAGWELTENEAIGADLVRMDYGMLREPGKSQEIERKLDEIVVPIVDLDGASLEEAIEYLEGTARALDPEIDEDSKGVSFVLEMGTRDSPEVQEILRTPIKFRLRNVPLRTVLEYITKQSKTRYRIDDFAVAIVPLVGSTNQLMTRRFRVPPNFLSESSSASSGDEFDPFAGGGENERATLARRLTAKEFLMKQGVEFPEGASASYSSGLGELLVRNTPDNLEFVETIVNSSLDAEPSAVVIETKIVRMTQDNWEELGMDATLTSLAHNGDIYLGGGTTGSGRTLDIGGGNPITSGLRSGDFAFSSDSITGVINREQTELPSVAFSPTSAVTTIPDNDGSDLSGAPGFLSMFGRYRAYEYSVLLRGLDQKKGVDLMTQPSVIARSGEQAIIESVREFKYPTEYEPPEIPNSTSNLTLIDLTNNQEFSPSSFFATPSHPTAFEERRIGTILEVLPIVGPKKQYVDLTIKPEVSDFIGFINYGTPITGSTTSGAFGLNGIEVSGLSGEVTSNDILMPVFETLRTSTTVTLENGETILLGGLLSETVEKVEDSVPILGSLPFIGRAFQSNGLRRQKEVIMIFVTAKIVDPSGRSFERN